MELDEFKTIIRKKTFTVWGEQVLADREIRIRNHTGSLIHEIKKSLRMEIAFAILFVFFICSLVIKSPGFYVDLFACFMAGFCICFVYYLGRLYRKIIQYQADILSIRKTLEQIINILQQFTRLYFILTLIMVPVILITAFFLVYGGGGSLSKSSLRFYSGEKVAAYIVLSVGWYIAMYFFTRWYIRRLYGNHLAALKSQLSELEHE